MKHAISSCAVLVCLLSGSAFAHNLLANLDLIEGRWQGALDHLALVRRLEPSMQGLAEREQLARDSLAAR